jgi:nucleoside 2-deoxyribosyltransferase
MTTKGRPMLIYLCAQYARFPELQRYAKELQALGHTITSRWIRGDHELRAHGEAERADWQERWALEDWHDLKAADTIIAFTEGLGTGPGARRSGRMVEFGMALALGKRCIAIGPRENVFFWLAQVEWYPTWQACLETVRLEAASVASPAVATALGRH